MPPLPTQTTLRRLVPHPHRESPPAHLVLVLLVQLCSHYFLDGGDDPDK
jgi:hypothetical protein